MLLVILHTETKFTDGDICADNTLIATFIHQLSLAASTLESSLLRYRVSCCGCCRPWIAHIGFWSDRSSFYDCTNWHLVSSSRLLFPFSPFLCVSPQDIDGIRAPIGSTQRACHWFTRILIMLKASHKTICVDLATTTIHTIGKIFTLFQVITANTAHLLWFKRSRWYLRSYFSCSLCPVLLAIAIRGCPWTSNTG